MPCVVYGETITRDLHETKTFSYLAESFVFVKYLIRVDLTDQAVCDRADACGKFDFGSDKSQNICHVVLGSIEVRSPVKMHPRASCDPHLGRRRTGSHNKPNNDKYSCGIQIAEHSQRDVVKHVQVVAILRRFKPRPGVHGDSRFSVHH